MPRGRAWTVGELAYIRRWAGRKPAHEIARHLKRTKQAVERQAQRMGVSLKHYESTLVWCPNCCAWRTRLTLGFCPVCSRKQTRAEQMEREKALLDRLAPEERALKRPELHDSRIDPKPKLEAVTEGMRPWAAARIEEQNAVLVQRWETLNLDRENAARRRRIERMEDQLKN